MKRRMRLTALFLTAALLCTSVSHVQSFKAFAAEELSADADAASGEASAPDAGTDGAGEEGAEAAGAGGTAEGALPGSASGSERDAEGGGGSTAADDTDTGSAGETGGTGADGADAAGTGGTGSNGEDAGSGAQPAGEDAGSGAETGGGAGEAQPAEAADEAAPEEAPVAVEALYAGAEVVASGYLNTQETITWELTADEETGEAPYTLRIAGTSTDRENRMQSAGIAPKPYSRGEDMPGVIPWKDYRAEIRRLIIGGGVAYLRDGLFMYHSALTELCFEERGEDEYRPLTIDSRAFVGCDALTSVHLPDFIREIDGNIFADSGVRSVTVDADNPYLVLSDGALYERYTDGSGYRSLLWYPPEKTDRTLTLPARLTVIGGLAFYGNEYLREVVMPESLREIGEGAFQGCAALETVQWSKRLRFIGMAAFRGCEALTQVELTDELLQLNSYAFDGCSALTELTIPGSLSAHSFQDNMASNCEALEVLTLSPGITGFYGASYRHDVPYDALKTGLLVLPVTLSQLNWPQEAEVERIRFQGTEAAYRSVAKSGNTEALDLIDIEFTEEEARYTITFDPTDGSGEMADFVYDRDTMVKLPANTFTPPAYYYFDGWSTVRNANNSNVHPRYADEAEVMNLGTRTLYAQWAEERFLIIFDGNGATSGVMDMRERSLSADWSIGLPYNRFVREGYRFTGWNTKQDGSGRAVVKIGDLAEDVAGNGSSVTLYAQWKQSGEEGGGEEGRVYSYDILFAGNEAGALYNPLTGALTEEYSSVPVKGSMGKMTAYLDSPVQLPANKYTRKGHIFAGFALLQEGAVKKLCPAGVLTELDAFVTPDEESGEISPLTLHALWMTGGNLITLEAGKGSFESESLAGILPYLTAESADALRESTEVKTLQLFLPAGKKIAAKQMPKAGRHCHSFLGWYTDELSGKRVKALAVSSAAGVQTLIARYAENTAVIRFQGGGPGRVRGNMKSIGITGETVFALPECTFTNEEGYAFAGWLPAWIEGAVPEEYPAGKELTLSPGKPGEVFALKAVWKPRVYSLSVNMHMPSAAFDIEQLIPGLALTPYGTSGNAWTCEYTYRSTVQKRIKLPSRLEAKGTDNRMYVLDHWELMPDTDTSGEKVSYLPVNLSGNKSLYAFWRPKELRTFAVYYAKEAEVPLYSGEYGGQYSYAYRGITGVVRQTFREGKLLRLRIAPVKAKKGYAFVGWKRNFEHRPSLEEDYIARLPENSPESEQYLLPGTPTGENLTVFYPVFAKRFEAVFDPAQGAFTEAVAQPVEAALPVNRIYDYGKGISKTEMQAYTPVREGYTFAGWQYTDYSGKTKVIRGALPKNLNRPVKLTALWKAKTVQVVFHHSVPAESGRRVKGSMKTLKVPFGQDAVLPAVKYGTPGLEFVCWSDEEIFYLNGGAGTTVFGGKLKDAGVLRLSQQETYVPEIHLYAAWKYTEYRISYEGQKEQGWSWPAGRTPADVYTINDAKITLLTPVRAGYVFDGWYTSPKFAKKTRIREITAGRMGDLVLYPKWIRLY